MNGTGFETERVLVLAKTYSEFSQKYGSLVCVAGLSLSHGEEWRRLYPVPWALFFGKNPLRFSKWDVIEVRTVPANHDSRPESRRILEPEQIRIVDRIEIERGDPWWSRRMEVVRRHLDDGSLVHDKIPRSLGIIRPLDCEPLIQPRDRIHDPDELGFMSYIQLLLPDMVSELEQLSRSLRPDPTLPWIGYRYRCDYKGCKWHEQMCIDWEIQELYRKIRQQSGEREAEAKTRQKLEELARKDLHFVVGTTWRYKTWLIIGLIYPASKGSGEPPRPER